MKHSRLLVPSFALIAACGGGSEESDSEQLAGPVAALEQSYGGIDTADEAPMFADPDVQDEDRMDSDVSVEGGPDREPAPIGSVVIALRYGDLADRDAAATDTSTASGQWRIRVAVEDGVFVRGRLYVDDGERPAITRLAQGVVVWTSTTGPGDHDGARFATVVTDRTQGVAISAPGLDFVIPLRELVDHESLHRTDAGLLYVRTYRVTRTVTPSRSAGAGASGATSPG